MSVAGIVLAAGESRRMGRLKQLLPWAGTTLVAWQVDQMQQGDVDDVVVVLGHQAETIRPALEEVKCRVVVNSDYKEGRASSLRCGAATLPDATEAVVVLGVDQPRPAWLTRALIEKWRRSRALIVSPRFPGGFGHPVVIDGSLLLELREVTEESLGLREVIDRHVAAAEAVTVASGAVDVDLNTPEAYAEALAAFERGEWQRPEP